MTIEQIDKIDIIGTSKNDGSVFLTIFDHLKWNDENKKLYTLQDEINSYLQFIESGQINEEYPESKNRKIIVIIQHAYK